MFGDSNHGAANFIAERAPESGGLTIVEGDGFGQLEASGRMECDVQRLAFSRDAD